MIRTPFKTAAAAMILAALGTSAMADSVSGHVSNVSPSVWVVKSNGQDYTQIGHAGNATIQAKLVYDTGTAGRVKSWEAWPTIGEGVHTVAGTKFYRQFDSYGVGNRPKSLNKSLSFGIPFSMIEQKAVQMCNMQASGLRQKGMSNTQIFGQNRDMKIAVDLEFKVEATGAGSSNPIIEHSPPRQVTVRCARWSGAGHATPGTLAPKPKPTLGVQAPQAGGTPKPGALTVRPTTPKPTTTLRLNTN
jgi:hypothetical protein